MKVYLLLIMTLMYSFLEAQEQITMYTHVPNTIDTANIEKNTPQLYMYIPKKVLHDKVFLILPGGGYSHHAMDHEGYQVATKLQELGYISFILKYRLPTAKQQIDKKVAPIQDAQRALNLIHEKLKALNISETKIGVMGFSAGGHLASTLSTHFDYNYLPDLNQINLLRPDFSILVYPVISMEDGITHKGSKTNLIGPDVQDEDVIRFSNDRNISKNTPAAFIVHAKDDDPVPIENSIRYKSGLDKFAIPNILFTYEKGGHGFGMSNEKEPKDWFAPMLEWLERIKL